jgi:CRISPR/Cas system-associated endonuclease Cas1
MNLYISEPKTHISISGQTLIITTESEVKKFPLGLLKSICLHKNVQITSQAICRLCEEGISIAWISSDRIVCQTFGTGNVLRQKQQFDILWVSLEWNRPRGEKIGRKPSHRLGGSGKGLAH